MGFDSKRLQRLDHLPVTRQHGKLVLGSGIGWALDAMDVGLISFIMAALATQWHLSPTEVSWLGSVGFIGMAIGASVGGLLADRYGRRNVFALTLLVYGLATGASALAGGLAALLVLRFIVGLGLGAELPVASTLVSEYSPQRVRGRMVVVLEAFWAVGWILAATIGYFVVPASVNGWRWAMAIGLVPAAYALVVRHGLPESVRYLESRGRHAEAERSVRAFETSPLLFAGKRAVDTLDDVEKGADGAVGKDAVDKDGGAAERAAATDGGIWARGLRRQTGALWITWFGVNFAYYGAFIWMPSLLVAQGFTLVKSFEYTLLITLAQLPGYALAAYLIEKWGRRATLVTFLAGSALSALAFGQAGSVAALLVSGSLLSLFNLGAWGALYAVSPEVYPTAMRAAGAGAAAAFGRIASIIAPLLVPVLLSAGGATLVFAVFSVAFALAAAGASALPELRGKPLIN